MTEEREKLTPEQETTVGEVFEAIFTDLEELRGSRIAVLASITGLVTVLSKRGVLKRGDEELIIEIAEIVSEKMRLAEAEGLDLDAFFRTTPKTPRPPSRRRGKNQT